MIAPAIVMIEISDLRCIAVANITVRRSSAVLFFGSGLACEEHL